MNRWSQLMLCRQAFHMQRIDHHTLLRSSYLGMFRFWQKNKDYNTESHMKTHTHTHFFPPLLCW